MVRANLSQVVIGNTNRATESRHATGAEAEIPDISEYSRGRKGYFQIWDPQAKEITARGRTFLLGVPPDELAYCKRIVDARRGARRALPGPDLVLDAPRGHAPGERVPGEHAPGAAAPGVSEMRARLAAARERNETAPRRQCPCPAPGRPRRAAGGDGGADARCWAPRRAPRRARPGWLSANRKTIGLEYLTTLRDQGIAELDRRAEQPVPARREPGHAPEPEPGRRQSPGRTSPSRPSPRPCTRPGRRGRGDPGGPGEGLGDRAPAREAAPHGGAAAAGPARKVTRSDARYSSRQSFRIVRASQSFPGRRRCRDVSRASRTRPLQKQHSVTEGQDHDR